ncbi:MAG: metallophosphoesterase [Clostridia bacterium]|nr:metallophosphoesterase [Clostridia bacterium]
MKILIISDKESELLLKYYKENRFDEADVVLSAGDLPYEYLQEVKNNVNAPLFYVRGNHDLYGKRFFDKELAEWKCVTFQNVKIAGIGCFDKKGRRFSENELRSKLGKLYKKIQNARGVDIILSHLPMKDLGDGDDAYHKGSEAIREFVAKTAPKYFVYGHNHLNYGINERILTCGKTSVINASEKYIFEY